MRLGQPTLGSEDRLGPLPGKVAPPPSSHNGGSPVEPRDYWVRGPRAPCTPHKHSSLSGWRF